MMIKKQPLLYKKIFAVLFMAGFLAGIMYANIIGKKYLDNSGVLSDYFLSGYTNMEIVNGDLFLYLIRTRLQPLLLLWVAGITIIGIPASYFYLAWMGFSGGMLISMSVMKFGFKGLVLCIAGVLPQYIIYIPVILLFIGKIYQFSMVLYGGKDINGSAGRSRKQLVASYFLSFLVICAAMTVGILLESYLNPAILKIILKKF